MSPIRVRLGEARKEVYHDAVTSRPQIAGEPQGTE